MHRFKPLLYALPSKRMYPISTVQMAVRSRDRIRQDFLHDRISYADAKTAYRRTCNRLRWDKAKVL